MKLLFVNSPKYDLVTAMLVFGLRELGVHELRFTSLGNLAEEKELLTGRAALDYANQEADAVLVCSRLRQNPWADTGLEKQIPASKKVFVDGTDESAIDIGIRSFGEYAQIFKRDIYLHQNSLRNLASLFFSFQHDMWRVTRAHRWFPFPNIHALKNTQSWHMVLKGLVSLRNQKKIFPLPLCTFDYMFQEFNTQPAFSLSCVLRPHTENRRRLMEELRARNFPRSFIGQIPMDKATSKLLHPLAMHPRIANESATGLWINIPYFEQLRNSQACLSLPGAGFYGNSFWEVLGAGSLLITKRIAIDLPNPFIENEHYLAFDSREELDACFDFLYAQPKRVDEIRRHGHEHARKHHNCTVRAEYFCDVIRRMKNPESSA